MNYQDKIYDILIEKCLDCKDDALAAAKKAPKDKQQIAYNKARREAENRRR